MNHPKGFYLVEQLDARVTPAIVASEHAEAPARLRVVMEAMHPDVVNKNFRLYPEAEVRKSLRSWVQPYPRPVLAQHDLRWGLPLGRVVRAKMAPSQVQPESKALLLEAELSDPKAIEYVQDKRFLTVSVGSIVQSATCSICGKNIVNDGFCEHEPGKKYKGKLAYWTLGDIEWLEVSFVNAPADLFAQVLTTSEGEEADERTVEEAGAAQPMAAAGTPILDRLDDLAALHVTEAEDRDAPQDGSASDGTAAAGLDAYVELAEAVAHIQAKVELVSQSLAAVESKLSELEGKVADKGQSEQVWLRSSIELARLARTLLNERYAEAQIFWGGQDPGEFDQLVRSAAGLSAAELFRRLQELGRHRTPVNLAKVPSPVLANKGRHDLDGEAGDAPQAASHTRRLSAKELEARLQTILKKSRQDRAG